MSGPDLERCILAEAARPASAFSLSVPVDCSVWRAYHRQVALAGAYDHRFFAREIDHCSRFDAAGSAIQNKIELALEVLANGLRVVWRNILAWKHGRRRKQGPVQFLEQRASHWMVGHAQAYGLAPFMQYSPRQLARALQDERVAPRRERL